MITSIRAWSGLASLAMLVGGGCDRARSGPPAPVGASSLAVAHGPFAGLFARGHQWRFRVEAFVNDASERAATESVCEVTDLRRFPGGVASQIECDDAEPAVRALLDGAWIRTATGLWHAVSMPDEGTAPRLELDQRVLPIPLHEGEARLEPADVAKEVIAQGDAWCVSVSFGGGETSWSRLCFDDRGPVSGIVGHGDETEHEVRFEVAED